MTRKFFACLTFLTVAFFHGCSPALAAAPQTPTHDPLLDQIDRQMKMAGDFNDQTIGALATANGSLVRTNSALEATNAKYKQDVAVLTKSNAQLTADNTNLTKRNANQAATITEYQDAWFSPIQKRLMWYFIGGWILYVILKVLAGQNLTVGGFGVGGLISIFAELIFAVTTGGTSILSLIFHNLWFRFWACESSFVAWAARLTGKIVASPVVLPYKGVKALFGKVGNKLEAGQKDFDVTFLNAAPAADSHSASRP